MNHKIIVEPSSFFRRVARAQIGGRWIQLAVAAMFYVLILSVVDIVISFIMPGSQEGSMVSAFYSIAVYGPAIVGMVAYALAVVREVEPGASLAFTGFETPLRCFSLGVQMWGRILLWSLLLIIPGIVAAYRYSMAPMILNDRPDLSPYDCIEESKRLMTGNKLALFKLQLSFIGWAFLACIPCGIITSVYSAGDITLTVYNILVMVCYIPVLFVIGYLQVATAVFYEEVKTPVEFGGYYGSY